MTGTADGKTQNTIIKMLLHNPVKLLISPERKNLRISVMKCKKKNIFAKLDWLVDLALERGANMPKTIIFCNMIGEIPSVANYLLFKMGKHAYHNTADGMRCCIVGVYHFMAWAATRKRLFKSFKGSGGDTCEKIIISSTALSMGVNFPDVRYVINWGPPRTLIDYYQEAGRAGWDGKQAHSIIIYHGNQAAHCEDDVKQFIYAEGCYRVASLKPFFPKVMQIEPPHDCCSNCFHNCKCNDSCTMSTPMFEKELETDQEAPQQPRMRYVSEQQSNDICDALTELKDRFKYHCPLQVHGFSDELVQQLVNDCSTIFSVSDILKYPVFSVTTAEQILEIFQDIFGDIDEDNGLNMLSTSDVYEWDGFKYDFSDMDNCNDNIPACTAEYLSDEEFKNL